MSDEDVSQAIEDGLIDQSDLERAAVHMRQQLADLQRRENAEQFKANASRSQAELQEWAREQGLTPEQAGARLREADARVREANQGAYGILEMLGVDPVGALAHLRVADQAPREIEREERLAKFKASFFEGGTDIASGLTDRFGPLQERPTFAPDYAGAVARAAERVDKRRETAADIRAALAAPNSRDIRAGFTSDGRKTTLDDVSGATERYRREQEEALARARAMMG